MTNIRTHDFLLAGNGQDHTIEYIYMPNCQSIMWFSSLKLQWFPMGHSWSPRNGSHPSLQSYLLLDLPNSHLLPQSYWTSCLPQIITVLSQKLSSAYKDLHSALHLIPSNLKDLSQTFSHLTPIPTHYPSLRLGSLWWSLRSTCNYLQYDTCCSEFQLTVHCLWALWTKTVPCSPLHVHLPLYLFPELVQGLGP